MSSVEARQRSRQAAWLLGAILFVASTYFYQDPEWNGNSRLALTRAIVEQGTFQIDDFHEAAGWATGDKAFFQGHYYSDKAIGASMMAVPVYFLLFNASRFLGLALNPTLIKHVLTTAVMGAASTLCGLAMYSLARRLIGDPWGAASPPSRFRWGPYSGSIVRCSTVRYRQRRFLHWLSPCSSPFASPQPAARAARGSGLALR